MELNAFTGLKTIFEKQKAEGIAKKLVGFELIDKGIPRQGYEINDKEGNVIGNVTSGTQSPTLGKAIGLGYVQKSFSALDTDIYIKVRDKLVKAKVAKIPFA